MRKIVPFLLMFLSAASSLCAVPKRVDDWDLSLLQASARRIDAFLKSCERVGGDLKTTDEINAFKSALDAGQADFLDGTAYLFQLRTNDFFAIPSLERKNGAFTADLYIQRYVSDCIELGNDMILFGAGMEVLKSKVRENDQQKMLAAQSFERLAAIKMRMKLIRITLADLAVFDIYKPKRVSSLSEIPL